MPRSPEEFRQEAEKTYRRAVNRRGLLLKPEQHPARHDSAGEAGSASEVSVDLLVAFVRRLVQNTVGNDAVMLAILSACHDAGVSTEEGKRLLRACLLEQRTNGVWPKEF